jgi:hypothetical protein
MQVKITDPESLSLATLQRMERREIRMGEICKAISRGTCDEVIGVDRM